MADRQNLDVSCVENLIFNLLLNAEENYDYPDLQEEALDNIANNLTDVICGVLKQKSAASSARRTNILRFINLACQTKEAHLNRDSYKIYLEQFQKDQNFNAEFQEIQNFLDKNRNELNCIVPNNFCNDVVNLYKKKNAKRREKSLKLEYIRNFDQERLNNAKFPKTQLSTHSTFYETSEELIRDLLETEDTRNCEDNEQNSVKNKENDVAYRENQIKFCYALLNIGDSEDLKILDAILKKLSTYKFLERFEINFLNYLWICEKEKLAQYSTYVLNNFPFVMEKAVLKFCTEILKLHEESEVCRYFLNLPNNKTFCKLSQVCFENKKVFRVVKSLFFELYCYSFCNRNILKLSDLVTPELS